MTEGHLYVAFGRQYDIMAARSVRQLRKVSKRPVLVVTNVAGTNRTAEWQGLPDVTWLHLNRPDGWNRYVKTDPLAYSHFDRTLYTDCDTLILDSTFDLAYRALDTCDMAFPVERVFPDERNQMPKLYWEAIQMFGASIPLIVYHGGVCAFRNTDTVRLFCARWQQAWERFGCGRDMPPLACMAQQERSVIFGLLPSGFGARKGRIIQHVHSGSLSASVFRDLVKFKPFDRKGQWSPVEIVPT